MKLFGVALLALAFDASRAEAQGLSGAAVGGRVVQVSGAAVEGARVRLIDGRNGSLRESRTDDRGRFLFENVHPGGPYRLEARAIGLSNPRVPEAFSLSLGERVSATITFPAEGARLLDPVVVSEATRADDAGGAGGPAFLISSDLVHGLPLLNRDFVGLFATIPQAVGRTISSIGGLSPALNAIQIDGGTANDVYGISRTPGSTAGAKAISLEALDEIAVQVAPFDVRQSTFTGALINAVTRSGTNAWRGEVFSSMQRPTLVGPDTAGGRVSTFDFLQYGASIGGPLIRDRLHFYGVVDLQTSRAPYLRFPATDNATGITEATATRAAAVLRSRYGIDAGNATAPVLNQPNQSGFAKLTWTISPHHAADFWHQEIRARNDLFDRSSRDKNNRDGWELSGSGESARSSVGNSRLRISSTVGSLSNEFIAGDQSSTDARGAWLPTPLFLIQGDVPQTYIAAGSTVNSQGTTLGQSMREVTDNVTWRLGAHELTSGAHAEWFSVSDHIAQASWGVWTFPSVDALEAGTPSRYEISLPLRAGAGVGRFRAETYAAYAQDRWQPSARLTVTVGARLDVPLSSAPAANPTLSADDALGRPNTNDFPSGNPLWSPRIAASWLIDETSNTRLRLGAGYFTGRPPFAWLGQAFLNTGLDLATVVCNPLDGVPAPVVDPALAPTRCTNAPTRVSRSSVVSYYASNFRFPQARKLLAGLDRALGANWSASLDLLQTTGTNAPFLTDANLRQLGTNAEGRAMYGTISSTGIARPTRLDSANFSQVFRYTNVKDDRSLAITIGIAGRWRSGARFAAGYQHLRARDAMGLSNPGAQLALQNTALDGTLDDRSVGTSVYEAPHNLTASGILPLAGSFSLAMALRAQSGRPFSYVSKGDANADGVQLNDLLYVPRSASDISLSNPELYPALDKFIEDESCLRSQRGRIVARNSCRNPGFTTLDTRLSKILAVGHAAPVELTLDVFNLPNLLNGSWGLLRETTSKPQVGLLSVVGWDVVNNRPRYAIPALSGVAVWPSRAPILVDESRWRIQLGARVRFGESPAMAATSGATPESR